MKQSHLARYVLISAIVLLPLVAIGSGDGFLIFVAGITYIHMLYATGLNLLYGFTGLIPLTYAGIAGVSAYTCVNLVQLASMPFWRAFPIDSVRALSRSVKTKTSVARSGLMLRGIGPSRSFSRHSSRGSQAVFTRTISASHRPDPLIC